MTFRSLTVATFSLAAETSSSSPSIMDLQLRTLSFSTIDLQLFGGNCHLIQYLYTISRCRCTLPVLGLLVMLRPSITMRRTLSSLLLKSMIRNIKRSGPSVYPCVAPFAISPFRYLTFMDVSPNLRYSIFFFLWYHSLLFFSSLYSSPTFLASILVGCRNWLQDTCDIMQGNRHPQPQPIWYLFVLNCTDRIPEVSRR